MKLIHSFQGTGLERFDLGTQEYAVLNVMLHYLVGKLWLVERHLTMVTHLLSL